MASLRALLLLLLAGASGCYIARSDARIDRGPHAGAAMVTQWTRDAEITNDDADLVGRPEREDGANLRGLAEAHVGYGWRHVDLTLHLPFLAWTSPPEGGNPGKAFGLAGNLDLYVLAVQAGGWSFGFGGELPVLKGYAVVTRELSPGTALSLTARVGPVDAQLQAAFVVGGPRLDVALVGGGVVGLGDDRIPLEFCDSACQHIETGLFLFFGLQVAAH